ncbi:hypothetical protein IMSAGC014_00044 [Bacteroidaceae bacterium]|nr:hypothetical protein IMSAGC014_00044 [Bacteroidaceae bacterium]
MHRVFGLTRFFRKFSVFEFKFPVFVLKIRYGLFLFHYYQPIF